MKTLKKLLQTQVGEISLTLSVLAIVVSVLGIALGSISVQQNLTRSTEAQAGTFPYESTLELRDMNNNVVNFENGMTWSTTILGDTNTGNIQTNNGSLAQLIWNGPAPENFRNQAASIVVNVPAGYELVDHFCDNRAGTTCNNINVDKNARRISNVVIAEGAKITYGWRIRPIGGSCEVSNCSIRNFRIDELREDQVRVEWDYPSNCPGYQRGTDAFWIDVIRPGSPDKIVCATDATDNDTTCNLGRPAPAGRQLDTGSEEYRKEEWDVNRRYLVNIYLYDQSGSCISQPAGLNFTYREEPEPTTPPVGGTCSNTKCTYSQEDAQGRVTCYEGNCLDGSENCSLNTNCGWIEGCSTGKWITCPGHTPTLAPRRPTSGPVQPTSIAPTTILPTIAPTTDPRTQCANENGACVQSSKICGLEGGKTDGSKGCTGSYPVCCKEVDRKTQCATENGACVQSSKICGLEGGRTDGVKGCSGAYPVCCKEVKENPTITQTPTTQCANENGACVQSSKICGLEGGRTDGSKGCTGSYSVCCKEIQKDTQCVSENGACVQSTQICNIEGGKADGSKGCSGNYPTCCKEIKEPLLVIQNSSSLLGNCPQKSGGYDHEIMINWANSSNVYLPIEGGSTAYLANENELNIEIQHGVYITLKYTKEEINSRFDSRSGNYIIDIGPFLDGSEFNSLACDALNSSRTIDVNIGDAEVASIYAYVVGRSQTFDNPQYQKTLNSSNPEAIEYSRFMLYTQNRTGSSFPATRTGSYLIEAVAPQRTFEASGCNYQAGNKCYVIGNKTIYFKDVGKKLFNLVVSSELGNISITQDQVTICTDLQKENCQTLANVFTNSSTLDMELFDELDLTNTYNINCEITLSTNETLSCNELESSYSDNIYLELRKDENSTIAVLENESERADLDSDGVVTALDLAILMDNYQTPNSDINGDSLTNALDYTILIRWIGVEN